MPRKSDVLVARVSYFVVIDGERYLVHRGKTTAHNNHPVVRGNEDKWMALRVDYAVDEKPEDKPAPPVKRAAPKKQAETKQEKPATEKESVNDG